MKKYIISDKELGAIVKDAENEAADLGGEIYNEAARRASAKNPAFDLFPEDERAAIIAKEAYLMGFRLAMIHAQTITAEG